MLWRTTWYTRVSRGVNTASDLQLFTPDQNFQKYLSIEEDF